MMITAEMSGDTASEKMASAYAILGISIERAHHRLLDVIKDEFVRKGRPDVTPVLALLLYKIGEQEIAPSELHKRGLYLGANVTYNLKKLVEMGLLDQRHSGVDLRSVNISLTDKGREVRAVVESLYRRHLSMLLQVAGISAEELDTLNRVLRLLDRFWADQILYRP